MQDNFQLKVKKLEFDSDAKIPTKAHPYDAGFDLYALSDGFNDNTFGTSPNFTVRTGIAIEIPTGYYGLIKERSSSFKNLGLVSCAGVIDSGYRGEVIICFTSTQSRIITWKKGDRLAQLIICPIAQLNGSILVENLSESSRGDGGFGSTGIG